LIFKTLQPHAEYLMARGAGTEQCFVVRSVKVDVQGFKENFEQNLGLSKPKAKVTLPILLIGKKLKAAAGRFQGNNPGNISANTFKKIRTASDFPKEWFPWLTLDNDMGFEEIIELFKRFNLSTGAEIQHLFESKAPLYTFQTNGDALSNQSELERMVSKSVYQVVYGNKPTLAVHSILALNALAQNAALFEQTDPIKIENNDLYKFGLLFWMLNKMTSLKIPIAGNRSVCSVAPDIQAEGNIGNIERLPLLFDTGEFLMGKHYPINIKGLSWLAECFLSLTREDSVDKMVLARNTVYTAPSTGKAPTNPFKKGNANVLSPEIMQGFDPKKIRPISPAYNALLQDHAFKNFGSDLRYYIFPERSENIGAFLDHLRDRLLEMSALRSAYWDKMGKKVNTPSEQRKKKDEIKKIFEKKRAFWLNFWPYFQMDNLIFAFEENVGSSNQQQYTWTEVFRNITSSRAYLFLDMVDDPTLFGRLVLMFKKIAFNLNDGWVEKEIKRIFRYYFNQATICQQEAWHRWRKYLIKENHGEDPISPKLWENAMALIIRIGVMQKMEARPDWTGETLNTEFKKERQKMDDQNQEAVNAYLTKLFISGKGDNLKEKHKKSLISYVDSRAKDYGKFVDTSTKGWEAIVDGLICGWALKQICWKLRGDDYKSIIGGRSLAKRSPEELRILAVDLLSKAERTGDAPWNVQLPLERMFYWSQQNPNIKQSILFMDAVSLGFFRYDEQSQFNEFSNEEE
jgi:hypothetical protein